MKKHPPLNPANGAIDLLRSQAAQWPLAEWKRNLPKLTPLEVSIVIPLATQDASPHDWQEKIGSAFNALDEIEALESLGSALDLPQFQTILAQLETLGSQPPGKLLCLFASLPHTVFIQWLSSAPENQLSFIRALAIGEPVQHQLSVAVRNCEQEFENLMKKTLAEADRLQLLELSTLGNADFQQLNDSIASLDLEAKAILHCLRNTLYIAWNTGRADLIESLSWLNDSCHRLLQEVIGTDIRIGLKGVLHSKIEKVFSDVDAQGNTIAMPDTTPALEALGKFSIWYPRDYEEIGLLPPGTCQKCEEEELMAQASKALSAIGLATLADLKAKGIVSKRALLAYISAR